MGDFVFGKRSRDRLATCHSALASVATRAIEITPVDFTIVHGWRGEEIQNTLFESGASKKRWPQSKHNNTENDLPWSLAIDFAPLIKGEIPWKDTHVFALVAGCWFAAAKERGVTLRWGGDWDMDGLTTDQTFMDWGHVELVL